MIFSKAIALVLVASAVEGFAPSSWRVNDFSSRGLSAVRAAPRRLDDNVDGPLYVNDKCINCSACSHFAPTIFTRNERDNAHHVYRQPQSEEEIEQARASLAACPVAAIRVENKASPSHRGDIPMSDRDAELASQLSLSAKLNGRKTPFPLPVSSNVPDVYYLGHHNEASFGATPYLFKTNDDRWIMVDTPKFSKSSVAAVESLTGTNKSPDYLFLTHVDDTADHFKWREHYGDSLKRVFHSGDLGRNNWLHDDSLEKVEVLLQGESPDDLDKPFQFFTIDGALVPADEAMNDDRHDLLVLHTPGHSPGSISLWKKPTESSPGVLFTGDMYGYTTRDGGHMTAFPRYSRDLAQQSRTIRRLVGLDWQLLAPGHSHVRDYTTGMTLDQQRQRHTASSAVTVMDTTAAADSTSLESVATSSIAVADDYDDMRRADMETAMDELRSFGARF